MGATYQTILVVGDVDPVRQALSALGREAIVAPAAERRWAVLPAEDEYGYADAGELALRLSKAAGTVAASFDVQDSAVLLVCLFRHGTQTHQYLSDRSVVFEWWDEDDNEMLASLDGTLHPIDEPPPPGPTGDDPAAFLPLGVGEVDPQRLRDALRGDASSGDRDHMSHVLAECQHAAILAALSLDPHPLTIAFRHAVDKDLPGAIRVGRFSG